MFESTVDGVSQGLLVQGRFVDVSADWGRQLSLEEIGEVSGGIAPILIAAAFVSGFAAGAAFAYYNTK